MQYRNYLALGDSYTVGEQVRLIDSFPYQLVKQIRLEGQAINAPEIIAKTAWTTTELYDALQHYPTRPSYDMATLLIGVNNQYRNLDIEIFRHEIELLAYYALQRLAGSQQLIMINIPDWGQTPFNKTRDASAVSQEIDDYNQIVSACAKKHGAQYIDVCSITRKFGGDERYLVEDQLHPSAAMYAIWTEKIFKIALNLSNG